MIGLIGWLVGCWLAGKLAGWLIWLFWCVCLAGCLAGWLVDWLVGWWVGWLVVCLLVCLFVFLVGVSGWVVGWLAGLLAGWLAGWLVGWLVAPPSFEEDYAKYRDSTSVLIPMVGYQHVPLSLKRRHRGWLTRAPNPTGPRFSMGGSTSYLRILVKIDSHLGSDVAEPTVNVAEAPLNSLGRGSAEFLALVAF